MKTRVLLLLVTSVSLALTGCAFMNQEDRDFYGKGWVHPSELDDVPPRRPPADPNAGDYQPPAATSSRAPQPAPEWIVPETSDNNQ